MAHTGQEIAFGRAGMPGIFQGIKQIFPLFKFLAAYLINILPVKVEPFQPVIYQYGLELAGIVTIAIYLALIAFPHFTIIALLLGKRRQYLLFILTARLKSSIIIRMQVMNITLHVMWYNIHG